MAKDKLAVQFGRKGGKARARKLTAEELSAAGRKAVEARWARRSVLPPSQPVPIVDGPGIAISTVAPEEQHED